MSGAGAAALELAGIDKSFGGNHANKAVSFAVRRGSIHGLIGENGAGKTTAMNIVYGLVRADAGDVRVGGVVCDLRSPADAIAAGIGMVHQHFMQVDRFDAVENVLLGREGGALLADGAVRVRTELARLAAGYGLDVPLDTSAGALTAGALTVGGMTVGERQRLEILKALLRQADILILDEPTAVLTPPEAQQLFAVLRTLRDQGRTVVLITHKLGEVAEITDRVTVMRQGAVVATLDTAAATPDLLAELMVGRKVALADGGPGAERVSATVAKHSSPVALQVEGLRVCDDGGIERVRGVGLSVCHGEIVGIAGVSGNGQSELLEALAGMRPAMAGTVRLRGTELPAGTGYPPPGKLRRLGMAHVPEDRLTSGLVPAMTAGENMALGYQDDAGWSRAGRLHWEMVAERCRAAMVAWDIRPADPDLPVRAFSGGNQQKLLLAREVDRDPAVLLVGQPTRGVDVGAIEFIHRRFRELRDAGKAILLVSAELDEILALSDRILAMCGGRIVGETTPAKASARSLGLMIGGVV